jgi:CelD/BcsL family acetyltransferase involved in cellulose biosynthesis
VTPAARTVRPTHGDITVVAADPVTDPLWHDLATTPGAGLFTSPPWLAAVCGSYGFTAESRIAVDRAGRPVGGLAWVAVDDPRGLRLLSLPFCDRADPPVPDTATWDLLVDAAAIGDIPFTVRCLDDSPAVGGAGMRTTGEAAWHGTPLHGAEGALDADELRRRISGQSRRNLATAERAGVRVAVRDDLEAVRIMHGLHVRLRKNKYGYLAQPREFFERIWQEFAPDGRCVTLVASVDGEGGERVIAAALFLEWNGALYYKFGASDPEHLHVRPNDAIYWTGIRRGLERGLQLVDWGLSDLDQPGLVRFKRKWATEERRLLTLRSGTPRPRPGAQEFGDTLTALTGLLTDPAVPDDVTARAGALLYRYFC